MGPSSGVSRDRLGGGGLTPEQEVESALDPHYHLWPGDGPKPNPNNRTMCGVLVVSTAQKGKPLCSKCEEIYNNQAIPKSRWSPTI